MSISIKEALEALGYPTEEGRVYCRTEDIPKGMRDVRAHNLGVLGGFCSYIPEPPKPLKPITLEVPRPDWFDEERHEIGWACSYSARTVLYWWNGREWVSVWESTATRLAYLVIAEKVR
jgi:hypothetical protein